MKRKLIAAVLLVLGLSILLTGAALIGTQMVLMTVGAIAILVGLSIDVGDG